MAASIGAPRRGFWVSCGLVGGIAGRRDRGALCRRNRRGGGRPGPGAAERGHPGARGRDARLAQHLDVAARPRARRQRPAGWRRGDLGSSPALCPRRGRRARRAARGVGDSALPLRHCGRRRSLAGWADHRRRARPGRRRFDRRGTLSGAAAHPDPAPLHGDELDGAAARRRNGGAGRRVSGAGRSAAAFRQCRLGHLGGADRGQRARQGAAHPGRLRVAAGRHAGSVLSGHVVRHMAVDQSGRADRCRRATALL